jgi:hypothetical protein
VPVRAATALFALASLISVALGQYIAYSFQPLANIPYDGRFTFIPSATTPRRAATGPGAGRHGFMATRSPSAI